MVRGSPCRSRLRPGILLEGLAGRTGDEGYITFRAVAELHPVPTGPLSPCVAVEAGLLAKPEFGGGVLTSVGSVGKRASSPERPTTRIGRTRCQGGPMDDGTDFGRVERLGLRLEEAEVGTSYGAPALKVRGRMFACIPTHRSAEPGSLAVRMSLVERDLRVRSRPDIYYLKPHYEPYPVVLVRLAKLSDDDLTEVLETGWEFERGKRKRR